MHLFVFISLIIWLLLSAVGLFFSIILIIISETWEEECNFNVNKTYHIFEIIGTSIYLSIFATFYYGISYWKSNRI